MSNDQLTQADQKFYSHISVTQDEILNMSIHESTEHFYITINMLENMLQDYDKINVSNALLMEDFKFKSEMLSNNEEMPNNFWNETKPKSIHPTYLEISEMNFVDLGYHIGELSKYKCEQRKKLKKLIELKDLMVNIVCKNNVVQY